MSDSARIDPVRLDPVESAVAAIAAGRAVVVVDDEDRENEGDLIFAANRANPDLVGFMVRHTSGFIWATSSITTPSRYMPLMASGLSAPSSIILDPLSRSMVSSDSDIFVPGIGLV